MHAPHVNPCMYMVDKSSAKICVPSKSCAYVGPLSGSGFFLSVSVKSSPNFTAPIERGASARAIAATEARRDMLFSIARARRTIHALARPRRGLPIGVRAFDGCSPRRPAGADEAERAAADGQTRERRESV